MSLTCSTVYALDTGADDYLTKPFRMGELLARVRVASRHGTTVPIAGRAAYELDVGTDTAERVQVRCTDFSRPN